MPQNNLPNPALNNAESVLSGIPLVAQASDPFETARRLRSLNAGDIAQASEVHGDPGVAGVRAGQQ